jgi:hypothetical protein
LQAGWLPGNIVVCTILPREGTGATVGDVVETLKKMWWTYREMQVFRHAAIATGTQRLRLETRNCAEPSRPM